jgi:hypothetical protein
LIPKVISGAGAEDAPGGAGTDAAMFRVIEVEPIRSPGAEF